MAMNDEDKIRLLIRDVEGSFFYPLFTPEDYTFFLEISNDNLAQAVKLAARTAAAEIAAIPTKERFGEVEFWNETAKNYLKFLDYVINAKGQTLPNGLTPWSASETPSNLSNITSCNNIFDDECEGCSYPKLV